MSYKSDFANTISDHVSPLMSDCEKYGMTWGCDVNCPVLMAGQCQEQEGENKELYQQYLDSLE